MKHSFTRWVCCMALLAIAGILAPRGAADDRDFVYLYGYDGNWNPPVEAFADQFENSKVYETSPGSKIYEGVFNFSDAVGGMSYFRFYTALADLPANSSETTAAYYLNIISPERDRTPMIMIKGAETYHTDSYMRKDVLDSNTPYGSWMIPAGDYRVHLDLNTDQLYLDTQFAQLAIINDAYAPTLENIDRWKSFISLRDYLEPGNLTLRLYDAFYGKWLNPAAGEEKLRAGIVMWLDVVPSDEMGAPFTFEGWPGGVISAYTSYPSLVLAADKTFWTPSTAERIWFAGDFNGWAFIESSSATPADDKGTIFRFTLPEGTEMFKISSVGDWSDCWGAGNLSMVGGKPVVSLNASMSADNIIFSEALAADAEITVDLNEGTVTFPSWVKIAGTPGGDEADYSGKMFVEWANASFEPWKGCSSVVMGHFAELEKQVDGSYYGEVYGDNFRIITEITEKGKPNKVLAPVGDDRQLVGENYIAYTTAVETTSDKAGFWRMPNDASSGKRSITVIPGERTIVKVQYGSQENCIYLVGSPNGWDINSDKCKLYATTDGGYYGNFEIAADDLFRFYSNLGSWETGSIGSGYDDEPITVSIGDDYTGRCYSGKGSWQFYDWPGGTMYMYVKPTDGYVHFSKSPIEEAGEIVTPGMASNEIWISDVKGESMRKLYTSDERKGIYTVSTYGDFRLFTRHLPITPDEPEWAGSYALVTGAPDCQLVFDDLGVAETEYSCRNEITADAGCVFHCDVPVYVTVDTNIGKIYVEKQNTGVCYLVGGLTDGVAPTYETRNDFRKYTMRGVGTTINIPAGKFNFAFCNSIFDATNKFPETEISFINGAANPTYQYNGWYYQTVNCADWTGGDVLVSANGMIDLSKVDSEIYAETPGAEQEVRTPLKRTGAGNVFKGIVPFGYIALSYHTLCFEVLYDSYIYLSSIENIGVGGIRNNYGAAMLVPGPDGKIEAPLDCNGVIFAMPSLTGSGEMEVTVDLDNMTMSMELPAENLGNVYETVSSDENIDGIVCYPSQSQPDAVTVYTKVSPEAENTDINFVASDGSVIEPASGEDVEVNFDENGCWSGDFRHGTPATANRANARIKAASAGSAKWHLNIPEVSEGSVSMLIDEKAGRITMFSTDCNPDYFIVTDKYGLENLADLRANMLKQQPDGTFVGELDVYGTMTFALHRNVNGGWNWDSNSAQAVGGHGALSTFNLVDATEYTCPATKAGVAVNWTVVAPKTKVRITFNPAESTLHVTRDLAGVENVSADGADALSVVPCAGGVMIVTDAAADVNIWSGSGMLVRSLRVQPGTTTVDLPAGLYIAAGHKIIVK